MTPEIAVIDFKWHLSSFSMANVISSGICHPSQWRTLGMRRGDFLPSLSMPLL
jgi:hypothetical protein